MADVHIISLRRLRSPKEYVVEDTRYRKVRAGLEQGTVPPIQVEPLADGTFRIQDGVRRAVAAREMGMATISAEVVRPTPGAARTIPLAAVKLGRRLAHGSDT